MPAALKAAFDLAVILHPTATKLHRVQDAGKLDRPSVQGRIRGVRLRALVRLLYGYIKLFGAHAEARKLRGARANSALAKVISEYRGLSALAASPFVAANWSSRARLAKIIGHCSIIDDLGSPFDLHEGQYCELISVKLGDDHCRFMLDRPVWLKCDGLITASLWVDVDRVCSISFCISDDPAGRTVYVGGIQGRRHESSLDQNRRLTKAAHGMRPSDLTLELMRFVMPYLGAQRLKCVANSNRYQRTKRARFTIAHNDRAQLDYDEIWLGRGGILGADGFFDLPLARSERDPTEIPAKKRKMYRLRYALLHQLEKEIAASWLSGYEIHQHHT